MNRHRLLVLSLLCCVLSCCLVSCSLKFCGDSYLAELEGHQGEVQRDEARAVGTWGVAKKGDHFRIGDGLRTGRDGSAQLGLSHDGVALVEANTVLRFLDRDPRGSGRVRLEEGVIRIDSGSMELDVHTPRALARVQRGASIRIIAANGDSRFDVLVGKVEIDAEDGDKQELTAGQSLDLNEFLAHNKKASEPLPQGKTPEEPHAAKQATATAAAIGEVDVSLPDAASMTLHAPTLPVVFRLVPPACEEETSSAEVDGKAVASAAAGAAMSVRVGSAGAHRVRVRCGKKVVRDSTVRVLRDAANLELPKSAQRVDLEADGRKYTVRYQNVMPVVNIHWSEARPASSYTLFVRRGKADQSFRVTKPERELTGNELMEGNYDFWFSSESGQQSRVGSLRIEFDNTARSLSLSEPVEGTPAEGETVLVSGVALLRSQVSANGVPLPIDPKGRFHAQVPLSAERSVLVRSDHPAAGVHYYLRRLR